MKKIKENPKNKTIRFSTDVFNTRLFLEGVKRLRVIITAVAILALALAIFFPVISWLNYADNYPADEIYADGAFPSNAVGHIALCPPLYLLPFAAPLSFLVLFSFLHKRKQSDFFHAIPYTRTCVFVSFSLAALAAVSAIAILCAVLSGFIYALCPYTTFSFLELLAEIGLSILSAAFLSSFMILALTLTGTTATSLLLFALFASITRVTLGLFSLMVNELTIVNAEFYPFLSPSWYLPFRIFMRNGYYSTTPLPPYEQIIPYTLLVTLLIFTLAGFVYQRRPSEMAERSAPSRILQAIFRSLFTLPFALLITALLVTENVEFSLFLALLVVTLLAFYLYELITTKRIRNLPRATPWLLAVFGGAVAFYASFVIFASVVTADIPKEKIDSISFPTEESLSYETIVTGSVKSYDARAIELVSDAIRTTRTNNKVGESPRLYRIVTIHKKNGQTVKRGLYFTEESYQQLNAHLSESEEYSEKHLELPPLYSVDSIGFYVDGVRHYNTVHFRKGEQELKELYELLAKEYKNLSKEEQLLFKRGGTPLAEKPEESSLPEYVYSEIYSPLSCTITISGTYKGLRYSSSYNVPGSMKALLSYVLSSLTETYESSYYESEYQYRSTGIKRISAYNGSHTTLDVTKALFRDLKTGKLDFDNGHIRLAAYGDLEYSIAVAKDEQRFIPFFEAIATHLESNRAPAKENLPVIITVDRLYSDTSTDEACIFQIIYLTEAEYKTLLETLWVED